MTIEEAVYCMKSYVDNDKYEHCISCPYYSANIIEQDELCTVYECNSDVAHMMAIASLEAWEKIKAEIQEIKNGEAKNHDSFDEYSEGRYDVACQILHIIDKHLEGVVE